MGDRILIVHVLIDTVENGPSRNYRLVHPSCEHKATDALNLLALLDELLALVKVFFVFLELFSTLTIADHSTGEHLD